MAIGKVEDKGAFIYVYDEKGRSLCTISTNGGKLKGYTDSTVSIQKGGFTYTYNEKGQQISCK